MIYKSDVHKPEVVQARLSTGSSRPVTISSGISSSSINSTMDSLVDFIVSVYALPYTVLQVPNLKLKKPSFVQKPSAMLVFAFVLGSYFLVTGGIIYDVIVEPPSVGSTTDEHGHTKPVAFMPYRVNGQYIMEGLASSFLFTLGGLGFIILDHTNEPSTPKLTRLLTTSVGFLCILTSFFTCLVFMKIKLP